MSVKFVKYSKSKGLTSPNLPVMIVTMNDSTVKSNLITKLRERQQFLSLSDKEFAKFLGIPGGSWRPWNTGHSRPGITLVRAVLRVFPELRDIALAEIGLKEV